MMKPMVFKNRTSLEEKALVRTGGKMGANDVLTLQPEAVKGFEPEEIFEGNLALPVKKYKAV